jgi:hypothetical protein
LFKNFVPRIGAMREIGFIFSQEFKPNPQSNFNHIQEKQKLGQVRFGYEELKQKPVYDYRVGKEEQKSYDYALFYRVDTEFSPLTGHGIYWPYRGQNIMIDYWLDIAAISSTIAQDRFVVLYCNVLYKNDQRLLKQGEPMLPKMAGERRILM